jgi:hypothetical protein
VIAYKFLRRGRVGPFSGFVWPAPGGWVSAGETERCRRGVHACRPQDLPWWLADELWEIELGGDVRLAGHKLVAPAGGLVRRVREWTSATAQEFADACAWRARDHAVTSLSRNGHPAEARALAGTETLDDVLTVARALADQVADARIGLTIAGDGAVRALTGAAPTSAYIAAHAAHRLDGREGYDAERAWQSLWLVDRLSLGPAGSSTRSARNGGRFG